MDMTGEIFETIFVPVENKDIMAFSICYIFNKVQKKIKYKVKLSAVPLLSKI